MNVLVHICPGDASLFWIAKVLVQVTVIILTARLLARLSSRWNAAWRHSIYVVALMCVLASPLLAWLMPATGSALLSIHPAVTPAPTVEPASIPRPLGIQPGRDAGSAATSHPA